jgi:hypothetical protein
MSYLAYESGLEGGADDAVASLTTIALEVCAILSRFSRPRNLSETPPVHTQAHLKNLVTHALDLIRSDRASQIERSSLPKSPQGSPTKSAADKSKSTAPPADDNAFKSSTRKRKHNHVSPLSLRDFSALFEISPHLLVDPHVGAVERLYASKLDPCESSDSSDAERDDAALPPTTNNVQTTTSPKGRPKSLGIVTRRPTEVDSGRQAYVIDSRSKAVPNGNSKADSMAKKERKQSKVDNAGGLQQPAAGGWAKANGTNNNNNNNPSSLALRSQLFPELDTLSDPPPPATPSLGDTTDDGAGSDSDHSARGGVHGAKKKAHGHGGGDQQQLNKKANGGGRKDSWKLDVVNPVRLFDGVLEG